MKDVLLASGAGVFVSVACAGLISIFAVNQPPVALKSTCEEELKIEREISKRCDQVANSCLGWQARVVMTLDRFEAACVKPNR